MCWRADPRFVRPSNMILFSTIDGLGARPIHSPGMFRLITPDSMAGAGFDNRRRMSLVWIDRVRGVASVAVCGVHCADSACRSTVGMQSGQIFDHVPKLLLGHGVHAILGHERKMAAAT